MDLTVLSYGIETASRGLGAVLLRNMTIPTIQIKTFVTSEDNQETALIQVRRGESKTAKNNSLLASFSLNGIPPAPKGERQISVKFYCNANLVTTVTAIEKSTGIAAEI